MMIKRQANGRVQWTNHIWDRQLCTNVAQLAVDVDDAIADIYEPDIDYGRTDRINEESIMQAQLAYQDHMIARLTKIRKGLNKVMEIIELENTTPRFSTKSIKAIDLIWAS